MGDWSYLEEHFSNRENYCSWCEYCGHSKVECMCDNEMENE